IIGTSCRLPGGILDPQTFWEALNEGRWQECSKYPPNSRGFISKMPEDQIEASVGRGGWLGEEGIENFDASFFEIHAEEAEILRPNIRLALELTYEALENAGLPPSALRGKNVSVSIGVGTEDGWDIHRWREEGAGAFDQHWAASSDPSGIAGHISHFFDFKGPCNTVSNACASGAFALRDGNLPTCHSLHCSQEGAVFLVLKNYAAAEAAGDPVRGIIRGLACGHNGKMRSLMTPNANAQKKLMRKAIELARLKPEDIGLLEAHGTGTPVGDALEGEAIRSIFGDNRKVSDPLLLSSSKTILGYCHGAAALVGILKIILCFDNLLVPPHHVKPVTEYLKGDIIVPTRLTPLSSENLFAQINSFGFTGSIASVVLE
ncbi:hypothetical protein M422DRAFT_116617, partial [Sphaerobolus stellatus SS14]